MFNIEDFINNSTEVIENPLDALMFGGAILLIGMLTIFAVLVTIWLSLTVFKLVFHDLPAKKKATVPVSQAPVVNLRKNEDENEIVAVIAAAIAMAESEETGLKFKVVSFKRK